MKLPRDQTPEIKLFTCVLTLDFKAFLLFSTSPSEIYPRCNPPEGRPSASFMYSPLFIAGISEI